MEKKLNIQQNIFTKVLIHICKYNNTTKMKINYINIILMYVCL